MKPLTSLWKNTNIASMWLSKRSLLRLHARVDDVETALRSQGPPPELDALQRTLADIEDEVHNLKLALAEGIERVDRAERRIKGTVQRARNKLADGGVVDDGLEAENALLRGGDGRAGPSDGVQPLLPGVAPISEDASSIKGVSAASLKRARGL